MHHMMSGLRLLHVAIQTDQHGNQCYFTRLISSLKLDPLGQRQIFAVVDSAARKESLML